MRLDLLFGVVLAAAVAVVFADLAASSFLLYDDPAYVSGNPQVAAGLSWDGLRWAFASFQLANWHPLTWLSHMLDVELFGLDAGRHHLVSVALHAANALLLFALLRTTTGAPGRSALAAGLFALHPLHVESVAWIAERKDVLCTLFWLLALLAWSRYARAPGWRPYALALGAVALALLAKPMPVSAPLTLLVFDFWPLGRTRWAAHPAAGAAAPVGLGRLLLEKLPFALLAGGLALVTLEAQRAGGALQSLQQVPPAARAATALVAYAGYLGKTLWPANLAVFYPHPLHWPLLQVALAAATLLALSALALLRRRAEPWLAAGWLWYLVTLAPVIGLVQVGGQWMADRYSYVPLIGIFIAASWSLAFWLARVPLGARAVLALALLASCGLASARQVALWRDTRTLFEHTLASTGPNAVALGVLGDVLEREGRGEAAIARYREAVAVAPDYATARYNLGRLLADAGQGGEAEPQFRAAVELRPAHGPSWFYLGLLAEQRGDPAAAVRAYERGLALAPDDAQARERLRLLRAEGATSSGPR